MAAIESTPEFVNAAYERTRDRVEVARKRLGRPLDAGREDRLRPPRRPRSTPNSARGEAYLALRPDRVAMQDATAQMALLQFMLAGRARGRGADAPCTATT